ncbi:hypothetical protein D3C72_1544590 [compost metagenome]
MFTSRLADITKSFCAPTFEPATFKSRPAIMTAVSPVKVEPLACSQSVDLMVCVVFDDRKPRFL